MVANNNIVSISDNDKNKIEIELLHILVISSSSEK